MERKTKCRTAITAALLAAPLIGPGVAQAQTSLHTPGAGDPAWMVQLRNNFRWGARAMPGGSVPADPRAGAFQFNAPATGNGIGTAAPGLAAQPQTGFLTPNNLAAPVVPPGAAGTGAFVANPAFTPFRAPASSGFGSGINSGFNTGFSNGFTINNGFGTGFSVGLGAGFNNGFNSGFSNGFGFSGGFGTAFGNGFPTGVVQRAPANFGPYVSGNTAVTGSGVGGPTTYGR